MVDNQTDFSFGPIEGLLSFAENPASQFDCAGYQHIGISIHRRLISQSEFDLESHPYFVEYLDVSSNPRYSGGLGATLDRADRRVRKLRASSD
ncbi:MAG: hypothetical protein C0497_10065 [Gemmatimonas sp.]|nr:hypothetical protein [Gemmatimonas sp.]